ncbi:MAG: hypothetical protein AAGI24_02500 [Pseudomonadota bacterium]
MTRFLKHGAALCLFAFIVACSDGNDSYVPPLPGPNLTLLNISDAVGVNSDGTLEGGTGGSVGSASVVQPTASDVASPGEFIEFTFTVRAVGVEAELVPVHFYLIERSKVAQLEDNEEAETFDLGDFMIEQVVEGETTYTAQFIIPSDVTEAGDYFIVGYIDAPGIVAEDIDITDNRSRGFSEGDETTYGDILIDSEQHHDFILHEIVVAEGFILIPEPPPEDRDETTPPDEVESHIIGHIDATKLGAGIVKARVAAEMIIGGVTYTAHLWTEEDVAYVDTMDITFPNDFEEHYFPWDITVNGELAHALQDAFNPDAEENIVTLRFTLIDISEDVEHRDDNNVLEIQVPYALYSPSEITEISPLVASTGGDTRQVSGSDNISAQNNAELNFNRSFGNTYGDRSKFAIGFNLGADAFVKQNRAEASFESFGNFNIYIFDNSATLLGAEAGVFAFGDTLGAGYNVGVSILGLSVFDESDSVSERLQRSWDRTWEEEQALFDARFVILIVPVRVNAGIAGSVGFGAGVGFDNLVVSATGDVFSAEIAAFAEASIDLAIASGGVGGSFLIISENFSITGTADLTEAFTDSRITLGMDITNELKAIEGEIYLFVRYPVYKFCCKVKRKEGRKTIYNTGSLYDRTWTLFSSSQTLNF